MYGQPANWYDQLPCLRETCHEIMCTLPYLQFGVSLVIWLIPDCTTSPPAITRVLLLPSWQMTTMQSFNCLCQERSLFSKLVRWTDKLRYTPHGECPSELWTFYRRRQRSCMDVGETNTSQIFNLVRTQSLKLAPQHAMLQRDTPGIQDSFDL